MFRRRLMLPAAIAALALASIGIGAGGASATATAATGGPGATSHPDQSRKDCVGTARNTMSRPTTTVRPSSRPRRPAQPARSV